jgi:hypothetical protein
MEEGDQYMVLITVAKQRCRGSLPGATCKATVLPPVATCCHVFQEAGPEIGSLGGDPLSIRNPMDEPCIFWL